jgi:hypothetical protein
MNEKLFKFRAVIEKRPRSPIKDDHGFETTVGTPRRGQGANGSGERSTMD